MVSTSLLVLQILHGLAFGMVLLLLSLGLSLTFGIAGVVNFAHGALYAAGAYVTYTIFSQFESFVVSLVGAVIVISIIALVIEIYIIRPLYERDHLFQLLATFGLVFIIEGAIVNIYGTITKSIPVPDIFRGPVDLGVIIYPKYRLFLVAISFVLTVGVWLILRTDYGARVRAVTYNAEMVDALGTDTKLLYTVVFVLGAALAALAGGLAGPIFTVHPEMGPQIIILVFIVVVIGGLGSFGGVILGSLIIGESLMLGTVFLGGYANLMPYVAMLVILLARPRGLMGQEVEL